MEKEDYKKEIGRRIRAARDSHDWGLPEFAKKTGLGKTALNNYETGYRMPGPSEINKIAKATGQPAAYLMCLESATPAMPSWIDPRVEDLPDVFKEAIKLITERYIEVASKLPVSTIMIFQKPTSENYYDWERGVEENYRALMDGVSRKAEEAPEEKRSRHAPRPRTPGRRSEDILPKGFKRLR